MEIPPEILTKLQQLRAKYPDQDSLNLIGEQETILAELVKNKHDLQGNPVFVKFAKHFERKINEITALLSNSDEYLNEKGRVLSSNREFLRSMAMIFSIKMIDEAYESIDKALDEKLDI